MVSPEAVALLDENVHRMPIRADQVRAVARALGIMRQTLGETAARASPHYVALLRLLRAHTRPIKDADVTFSQVQAVRLQLLAHRLLKESQALPPQLVTAIRQGLVAGFDPNTGTPVASEDADDSGTVKASIAAIVGENEVSSSGRNSAGDLLASMSGVIVADRTSESIPWSERQLPVRRADMAAVKPPHLDPLFLLEERERALSFRTSTAEAAISEILAAHEATSDVLQPSHLDIRTAALLEARRRHVSLIQLQRTMRVRVIEEYRRAESEGRRGSKTRSRTLKQLQREHEKLERARIRREEAEERESRKRQQSWMNALVDHVDRFRRYHRDVVRRGVRAILKSMSKYHEETSRNATRAERDAERARIQKLKDDDEEGYLELVRKTKNARLLELLNQTDQYLKELGAIVKEERARTGEVEYEHHGDEASDEPAKVRYYNLAHAIKEEIQEQPTLMVGGRLKEYQVHGIQWMVSLYNNRLNGILADEMGLGKTIQTLGLITYLMETKENAGPYLIIVPLSTMSNWEMEFARWAPAVTVTVFKGDSKNRRRIYETIIEKNKFNVCLATYEYVVRGKNWLKRVHWQHIIIDEGHRIKNHESRLSSVLHSHYTSRSRLLLTGTPLQNSLTELWALLNFLLPNVFKSAESFESWFAAPFAQMGVGNITSTEEQAHLTEEESLLIIRRLHQVLRPFLLRRLKSDVLRMGEQLPDKQEHIIICDMSAWQRSMYLKIVKSERMLFTDRHGRRRYDRLSNPAMQLRKCVNHPYLFHQDHSAMVVDSSDLWRCAGKFDMLDSCIAKFLRTGHRILVFNQMTKVVDLQARMLRYRKIPFYRLDGSTCPEDRKRMVSDFNRDDSDVHVFLLTTRAGGLGVNLQTADTVIIFDSDWNPSMDQQAQDRAHRIGQQREVLILRMITAKSVEEDIIERASFKRGLEEKIIRAGMFDESSKDSERQAMLRELLRVEEAASDGEDGDGDADGDADGMPTDEEINRLLVRSEEEFDLFTAIDEERKAERNFKPNLFTDDEIPSFASKVPKNLLAKAKSTGPKVKGLSGDDIVEDLSEKPKRRAASMNISYGLDSLSENQYIKLMEKSAKGEFATMSDGIRSVQGRRRKLSKQATPVGELSDNKRSTGDGMEVEDDANDTERMATKIEDDDSASDRVDGTSLRDGDGQVAFDERMPLSSVGPNRIARRRVARVTDSDSDDDDEDSQSVEGTEAQNDDDEEGDEVEEVGDQHGHDTDDDDNDDNEDNEDNDDDVRDDDDGGGGGGGDDDDEDDDEDEGSSKVAEGKGSQPGGVESCEAVRSKQDDNFVTANEFETPVDALFGHLSSDAPSSPKRTRSDISQPEPPAKIPRLQRMDMMELGGSDVEDGEVIEDEFPCSYKGPNDIRNSSVNGDSDDSSSDGALNDDDDSMGVNGMLDLQDSYVRSGIVNHDDDEEDGEIMEDDE